MSCLILEPSRVSTKWSEVSKTRGHQIISDLEQIIPPDVCLLSSHQTGCFRHLLIPPGLVLNTHPRILFISGNPIIPPAKWHSCQVDH
jgi:hypothetical protein